jgi:hypothetical protein
MISGACRCGSVTYRLAGEKLPAVYACHCLDCQTWSGSAFAEHALMPEDAIAVDGTTTVYRHGGEEGGSEQVVCETCFTRIYNRNSAVPGMVVLRAGTLAASDRIAPVAHIWTMRKQPWLVIPDDVPTWPGTPSPQEFFEATQKQSD